MIKLFDAHFHIIDYQYPISSNQGYSPPTFLVEDYLQAMQGFDLVGGALVSGSFQGFDQAYLLAALEKLGPNFVGVTQLPATTTDEEIIALDKKGVRALRFNIKRGGSEGVSQLNFLGNRVYDLVGWPVELLVDSSELGALKEEILKLPVVSVDHMGLSSSGYKDLLSLVEQGVYVKASGFGRLDFDVLKALKQMYTINPHALRFGSDLPSTRAPIPFKAADVSLIVDNMESTAVEDILYKNALTFYRVHEMY
jgi:predicted TIM-barrel fold metal-dependent hydrolase